MRMLAFSKRCAKEILRDPVNLFFGLGFPAVLLMLLSAIQANIPAEIFKIEKLSSGIAVFSLAFITLFSATLIAKDKESLLLQRLYTTPLKATDFILGYMLPLFPMAIAQSVVCYLISVLLGLPLTVNIMYAVLMMVPISLFYISLGLLCGSILTVKQTGAICGALLTNLSAWLSGVWFDIDLVGKTFKKIAELLPFVHAVELQRAIINGEFNNMLARLLIVLGYTVALMIGAVLIFLKGMKNR